MLALFKKKKKKKLPARIRGNSCLNCNVNLEGTENFCPDCGQRNNVKQLSFKLVRDEFFGDMFSYDSRLWRTVIPLIIKPGKVAYEFIAGRRKDFVNPFRTYLTISLIFFLVLGLLDQISELQDEGSGNFQANFVNFNNNSSKKDSLEQKKSDSVAQAAFKKVQKDLPINLDSTLRANNVNFSLDSIDTASITMDSLKTKVKEQSPFIKKVSAFYEYYEEHEEHSVKQALDSLGYENTFWNRFYYDKARDSNIMMKDKGESFNKKIFSGASIAIFLLLPVFAWFLRFFYIRRKYTYMEHMVFIFYTQSVFFLLLLIFSIIYFFTPENNYTYLIAVLLFSIYLLLAMKNFYKQNWFKTIMKYMLANFSFWFIASIGFALLTFISFIFY